MAGAGDCGAGVVGAGIAVIGGVDDQCQRHRVEAEQAVEIVLKLGPLLRAVENQDDLGSAAAPLIVGSMAKAASWKRRNSRFL